MRLPIQCEGIERGPERAVNMAVDGSVSPQFDLGSILGTVGGIAKTLLPIIAGAL